MPIKYILNTRLLFLLLNESNTLFLASEPKHFNRKAQGVSHLTPENGSPHQLFEDCRDALMHPLLGLIMTYILIHKLLCGK